MRRTRWQPIRQSDSEGLLRAGFEWMEPRPAVQFASMTAIAFAGAGAFLANAIASVARELAPPIYGFAALCVATAVLCLLLGIAYGKRPRAIAFDADGAIRAPHGFPGYPFRRQVEGHHDYIVNVQSMFVPSRGHGIVLLSHGGDTVWVSAYLDETSARKAVAQLNIALLEIRQSVSDSATRLDVRSPVPDRAVGTIN